MQIQYIKVFKNQELLYKTKNTIIKSRYVAYHDSDFFFVIYLAYVNKEIFFYLVPHFMDQRTLKNIFINHISQIFENFQKKLKDILTYLFKTKSQIDISFETFPPLFQINGSIILA